MIKHNKKQLELWLDAHPELKNSSIELSLDLKRQNLILKAKLMYVCNLDTSSKKFREFLDLIESKL